MDRVVASRRLLAELVKAEQIELRRMEIVGRDLAELVATLGRPPSGLELEAWLDDHAQVTELYAAPSLLDELVFRHLTPPPADGAETVELRHPDLERQIHDAPERDDSYLVYADWLQERGDPMGELLALGVATSRGADGLFVRFERHLQLHKVRFLGGLAGQLTGRVNLRWRNGVVHAIEQLDNGLTLAAWEQLLNLRVCTFVQAITLVQPCSAELDATISACAGPSLRELTLEGCHGPLPAQLMRRELKSLTLAGPSVALDDGLPASLERLEIRVREVTRESSLAWDVRELYAAVTPSLAEFLTGVQLARVERLTFGLEGTSAADLPALLRVIELPRLTSLAICDGVLDATAFAALAAVPLAARLSSLELTNLGLADVMLPAFAKAGAGFAVLAELDVSYNELTLDGLAIARKLAPKVINVRQHKPGNAVERRVRKFAGSRLQVAEGIVDSKAWRASGIDGDLRWARFDSDYEYELCVSTDLSRYGCSCPSSIQPCKHVVALALRAARGPLPPGASDGIEERVVVRVNE